MKAAADMYRGLMRCILAAGLSAGGIGIRGRYRDTLVRADGTVLEFPERHNQIQNMGLIVQAALLRGYTWPAVDAHIRYMDIGAGNPAWDAGWPSEPALDVEANALFDWSLRVPVSTWTFLDGVGEPTATPTMVIRAEVILGPGVGTGTLREFGFFGGGSGAAPGVSDHMVNWVAHQPIYKGPLDTLTRRMSFIFTPVFGPEEIPMSYFNVDEEGVLTMFMNQDHTSKVTLDPDGGPGATPQFVFYLGGTPQGYLDNTGFHAEAPVV